MRKTVTTLLILTFAVLFVTASIGFAADVKAVEYKTISELGNPVIAGTSYYDDGTLYYANSGSTVGYQLEHGNTVFDFDIVFNRLTFPSWFSLTLKAGGFDRTQSPNLTQKGYSFVIFPAGTVEVWKNGATLVSKEISPIIAGEKSNIQIGALNKNNTVNLVLKINNVDVIDYTDASSAYLSGDWFNVCADGPDVNAELISTKTEIYPEYHTYTLSTLKRYPTIANPEVAKVDKYNNIELTGSAATVGFYQALQSFSLETNVSFKSFVWPANFYIGVRAESFDRVMSSNLNRKGYSFRINAGGVVEIYKETDSLGSASSGIAFETGKNYVLEIGAVDINEHSTNLFVKINNKVVLSVFDNDNPIRQRGWININADGDVSCKLTSSSTDVNPLTTTLREEGGYYVCNIRFQNPVSYKDMNYDTFGERNLKAIQINGDSVYNINKVYYANSDGNGNAVDLKFYGNTLEIRVAKTAYYRTNNQAVQLKFDSVTIGKTTDTNGLYCPSGFVLKNKFNYFVGTK